MASNRVIMDFVPPSYDDLDTIASAVLDNLPDELDSKIGDVTTTIEDMVDEVVEEEMDLDDPYDLPVLFKPEKEIAPGVERTDNDNSGVLIVYRKPVLDEWCDGSDDLQIVMRQMIIEEFGRVLDLPDDLIADMCERHDQSLL